MHIAPNHVKQVFHSLWQIQISDKIFFLKVFERIDLPVI